MFGMNMDSQTIYHVPGDYHGQVSTFSFLDGHTEVHHWRDPQLNEPKPPPANWHDHTGNTSSPAVTLILPGSTAHHRAAIALHTGARLLPSRRCRL
jgi:hypothetical protein